MNNTLERLQKRTRTVSVITIIIITIKLVFDVVLLRLAYIAYDTTTVLFWGTLNQAMFAAALGMFGITTSVENKALKKLMMSQTEELSDNLKTPVNNVE